MRAALRLVVVAVPMGVLLSRAVAWMASGRTHAELITRLKGSPPTPHPPMDTIRYEFHYYGLSFRSWGDPKRPGV